LKKVEAQTSTTDWSGSLDRAFNEVVTIFGQMVFGIGVGVGECLKLAYKNLALTVLGLVVYLLLTFYIILGDYHLSAWKYIDPISFDWIRSLGFFSSSNLYHFIALSMVLLMPVLFFVGFRWMFKKASDEKKFRLAKLKNSEDAFPRILKRTKRDKFSTILLIDPKGIGASEFEAKKDQLEGLFKLGEIEEIRRPEFDQSKVELLFTKAKLPDRVDYKDLDRHKIPADHFIIGETREGVFAQDISELPHMLIAGMTGSGKSVFFKQVLMSLLKSTQNIQMHLVDLKGGLEMSDFSQHPKVKIIDNVEDTLDMLKEVKYEMEKRFAYLKKIGKKTIVPSRDKMPRIIVGIDECSVLYMKKNKGTKDYYHKVEAREITDDIAKLSRAAGIHLVLATQKVTKETIDTSIQDNIAGKVCFKMSGNQASILVLGNKKAEELPQIKGRAIWHYGQDFIEFQGPYIDEEEIKSSCLKSKEASSETENNNDAKTVTITESSSCNNSSKENEKKGIEDVATNDEKEDNESKK